MTFDGKAHRELEDRVRDVILSFGHEHAPLIRRCSDDLFPGIDPKIAAICMFLGNAAEQLANLIGKQPTIELVSRTLDSVEVLNQAAAASAQAGIAVDPIELLARSRTTGTS